jgi:hypothetical protein
LSSVFKFFYLSGGTALIDPEAEETSLDLKYFKQNLARNDACICNNFDCDRFSFSQFAILISL